MRLIKLEMENIRSYLRQEIAFDQGSSLLWGNIGSGKSTILLAIDFALFGLQRANLTGPSLLRNGASHGFVELHFSIENKEYIIRRTLKRGKSSVTQDAGYIVRNGIKEDKTAVDLKQAVLEILNYPQELLTKNKSLIYRYTVYTPQEEMKSILLGSKEDRLDTLRKVFSVDKYKRIKVNAKVVNAKLREQKKFYEGRIADLPAKKAERDFKLTEQKELESKIAFLQPSLVLAEQDLAKRKEELSKVEKDKEELYHAKKEIEVCKTSLQHTLEQKRRDVSRLDVLRGELAVLEKEDLRLDEDWLAKVKEKELLLQEREKAVRELLNQIAEVKAKKSHSSQIKAKFESLNNCPTCLQIVAEEHKSKIIDRCSVEAVEHNKHIAQFVDSQTKIDAEITHLRKEIEVIRKKEAEMRVIRLKLQQFKDKKREASEIEEKQLLVKKSIGETNAKIMMLQETIEKHKDLEATLPKVQTLLEQAQKKFNELKLEENTYKAKVEPISVLLTKLNEEIEIKERFLEKKEQINAVRFWLEKSFIPLMDVMERNILLTVYNEFNSLFEKWFSILIDNQTLQMSLDEDYTPKILQNGYDIDYMFLSGGEKTAGALAYRLALNQVINNLNTGLRTKDLLILDEPTDGFSHEQLDRLRLLLDELNIPQIIIVSHEPMIESFVDNIVKLEKIDHVTRVVE